MGEDTGDTIYVVTEVDLPDQTKYLFEYDSGGYGLLTKMTLPTGAVINYSYSNFTDGNGNVYRWVTGRTTPDAWSYTPNLISSCPSGYVNCQQQLTEARPSGDSRVYTFTLNGGSWPTNLQYNDQSGLLATVNQCFSFVPTSGGTCSYGVIQGMGANNVTRTLTTTTYPGTNIKTTTQYGVRRVREC